MQLNFLKPRRAACSIGICLGVAGLCLTGCASSEKSGFTDHLTATVAPGPAGNDDVIMAFGVDPSIPATAVAQGGHSQQDE